jgi:copper chaperone CopZ
LLNYSTEERGEIIMKKTYKVEVDCANCAAKIEREIAKIEGVDSASINFMTQKMVIESETADFNSLIKTVEKVGKGVDSDFEVVA